MRKYGLTIDNLLSVDLITAEGEFVRARSRTTPISSGCGAGGNFGIVMEFEFRLNPLGPQVVAGPVFWPMEEARTSSARESLYPDGSPLLRVTHRQTGSIRIDATPGASTQGGTLCLSALRHRANKLP
jgi:FAD/FMN-containing dehydrogenase